MHDRYLEITFRKGKPIAAYLYLERVSGMRSAKTEPREKGMIVDYGPDGRMIGIEITAPAVITLEDVNAILQGHGLSPLSHEELAPLRAA